MVNGVEPLVEVYRLLIAVASLVVKLGFYSAWASVVVVCGLSCPEAYGIFLDQKWNLSPALAGGFLATGPPGKSRNFPLLFQNFSLWTTFIESFYSLTITILSNGEKMALRGAPWSSIHQLGLQGMQEGLFHWFSSVQFSSVAQSCPTLCDPMNRSTPGLPVHHQLPEFTQTHVHQVSDAIQPSHPLPSPSPPAPKPSQHQNLFQ